MARGSLLSLVGVNKLLVKFVRFQLFTFSLISVDAWGMLDMKPVGVQCNT